MVVNLSLSLPAHVASFTTPPSDLSHRPLPAIHTTISLPPSSLQPPPHLDRSCCAVCISLPAPITLSARCHHCHCNPLLAPTALVAPSTTCSCRAVPPPVRQHHPHLCCHDIPMQKSQDTDVDVNIGVDCICLASLTIDGAGLSRV